MALTRDFIVKNGLVVLAAGSAQSISTTTGAIVTPGGVGIGGNVNIGSTINSTNATNGALTVAGGASVQQDLWVGGDIYSRGNPVLTSQTIGAYGVSRINAGVGIQVSSNTGSVTVTNIGVVSLAGSTYLGISAASGSNITLTNLGVQTLTAGTDTAVSATTGTITVWNTSTLQSVTARGASTINAININNQAASNSTNTGALQVLGGVGVGGSVYAGALFSNGAAVWTTATLTNLNQLSNTTTQYLTSSTLGQYGVSSIQAGTGIAVSTSSGVVTVTNIGVVSLVGSQYLGISAASGTSITLTNLGVQSLTAGADISVSGSTGTITVSGTGTFQTVTARGSTTTNAIRIANTSGASSTTTGALQVVGGVGIGGGLVVGGTITATNLLIGGYPISTLTSITAQYFGSPIGSFNTINFASGTTATVVGNTVTVQSIGASVTVSDTPPTGPAPGNLWWDSTSGILRVYYADGTSNQWVDAFPVIQGPTGAQGPAGAGFAGTTTYQIITSNTTPATSTSTGALQVAGGAGIAGDLYVGGEIVANKLTIQLTTITTTLVQTDDIIQTLNVTPASSTITGALIVAGGAGIGGDLYASNIITADGGNIYSYANGVIGGGIFADGIVDGGSLRAETTATIAGNVASTSTNSGALQVIGGVGIGGALYVGNTSYIAGAQIITTATIGSFAVTSSAYATTSSLAAYATTSSRAAYATTASIAAYATTASLASYATTASLASYATTSSIASTATSAAVAYSIVNTSTLQVGFAVSAFTATSAAFAYSFNTGTLVAQAVTAQSLANSSSFTVGFANTATNIAGGTAGMLPMQGSTGTTTFINAGTTGQVLQSQGSTASFVSTTTLQVGFAVSAFTATSAAVAYSLASTSTTQVGFAVNAFTATSAATAYSLASTSTTQVGFAVNAFTATSAAFAYSFNTATLVATAVTALSFNTSTLVANSVNATYATTATNIAAGSAGMIPMQGSTGTTTFINAGTSGQLLQSQGSTASFVSTTTLQVGNALFAVTATSAAVAYSLASTSTTQVGFAVNAFTATNAAFAWSFNTATLVANAVTAQTATNAAFAYSFNTGTLVTTAVTALNFNTNTVVTNAVNATNATNALYANTATNWLGGTVNNNVTFGGTVTFNGSATYVLSTNTVYTDNLIELHTPPGGVGANWTSSDGKDIGLRMHYYINGTDTNAALVLAQDTGYLEWYSSGTEVGNIFSGTYGGIKAGSIILASTSATINSSTGALVVAGGVGIGGSAYVAGNLTVLGTINATVSGTITTATNITGGAAGQIHMQTGAGATSFIGAGTTGQLLQSQGSTASFVSTTTLQVGNAVNAINATTATSAAVAYSIVNTSTLQVGFAVNAFTATNAFFASTATNAAFAWSFNTATVVATAVTATYANITTNLAGASAGYLPIQSGTSSTSFIAPGTAGDILRMQIGSTATFVSTSTLQVGNALFAVTATSAAIAYSIVNTSTLQVGFAVNAFTATNAFFASSATFAASFNTGTLVTTAVNQQGGSVNATTGVFSGIVDINDVTASTTTATGALQVAGGVGIAGNLNVGPGATNRGIANANAYGNLFTTAGDSQVVNYILGIKTTNNTAVGVSTDHAVAGATNQIIMPNNSAYGYKAYVTARDTTNAWVSVWEISGAIRRGANAASTRLVGTPVVARLGYDTTATTWAATAVADTTNGGLQVRVTGTGTTNITWVASVLTIEVA